MGILSLRYSERLIMRFGARTMLFPGLILIASGCCCSPARPFTALPHNVLPVMLLFGLGHRQLVPLADDPGDVGRDPRGRGPGLGTGEHLRAGRRRARPGGARDALRDPYEPPARRRLFQCGCAGGRISPRVRNRRGADGACLRRRGTVIQPVAMPAQHMQTEHSPSEAEVRQRELSEVA